MQSENMLVNVVHVKCILKSAFSVLDTFWDSVGSCAFQCAMRVQNTKIEVYFCEQRRWMRVAKTKRKMANEKWKIYFILNCLVCNNSNILFIVSYRLSLCHFWNIVFYWADVQNLWIGSRRVVRVHCDRSNERTANICCHCLAQLFFSDIFFFALVLCRCCCAHFEYLLFRTLHYG